MADNKTFTLIGKFDDQITKKLKDLNKELEKLGKPLKNNNAAASLRDGFKAANTELKNLSKTFEDLNSRVGLISKPINGVTRSLNDAASAAGKVRDTVSQIGEGVKGLDGITESLSEAARMAGRTQEEVAGIGEAAGRATRQAEDLMTTLLKADALSKFGDAMASGFERGMRTMLGTAQKGAGLISKLFKESMEDELADVKAASGIEGSFRLKGYEGSFKDSQKMYKKYDQVVSEMIRQSSAPTAKVVELQRYTLDTMGPLMLAAEGVAKGTKMKDIDPKKLEASAKNYGAFLEKAALFSQGTGSAGFRVAAGIEGLVTRGKIDTTIDFFTDNIMLMKNLEEAGFMGRQGGGGSGKMMNATDAVRMKAMMDAFNKSMSSESTKAMASSLTGSLQGLQDTIFNPSVGILGMSVTFSKEEQKKTNEAIRRIQNERIAGYTKELNSIKTTEERKKQLRVNIEQASLTRDQLISEDTISTPFQAFSFAFANLVRKLTEALNAIGPVWTNFAIAAIDVTNKVFGPLGETLGNVASDMRAKKVTQAEGFGRIIGEIFKTIGQIMGDLASMINDPNSAMGKVQSEFMKGFMAAFKEPGTLKAAQEGLKNGITTLIGKLFEFLWKTITFEPIQPLILLFVAGIFGPPLIGAVIAGATPLIISAIGRMVTGSLGGGAAAGAAAGAAGAGARGLGAFVTPGGARLAKGMREVSKFASELGDLGYSLAGRPGAKMLGGVGRGAGAVGKTVGKVGRYVPGGALAFGAIDAGLRMASGEDAGRAIGGAAATTIGSTLGGILGQALIPIPGLGAAVGAVAGGVIGDKLFQAMSGPAVAQKTAAEAQKAAADAMNRAREGAAGKYFDPSKLGGVEAISQRFGGGAGLRKALSDPAQVKSLGLSPEGVQQAQILAGHMTRLNGAVSVTQTAQNAYSRAVALNTGNQELARKKLEEAQAAQRILEASMRKAWETTSSQERLRLTGAAGALAGAINDAAAKLRSSSAGISGKPFGSPDSPASMAAPAVRGFIPGSSNNKMSLDEALSSEMRNKPSGSHLVIANSTETVIPAAQGYTPASGGPLPMLGAALSKYVGPLNKLGEMADGLRKLRESSMLFGGGSGSLLGAKSLAAMFGLSLTSFIRPHSVGSYHQTGRAMDFSNSDGPTPQMMAFAREMIKRYGSSLTELIYTPLGFSVKNGRKVAPLAAAGHYNHVHVAYALGQGNPAFFSNQNEAMAWERKMMPSSAKVASFTANTSEGFGHSTINAPITIYQQPNQDPEELASMVAMRIGMVVDELRNH